jgi:mRNA-degrading endonuclease RelE of RelBE toxin-antitoxin system
MHEVIVERSAEKDLKKLSSEVRPRAVTAMMALHK